MGVDGGISRGPSEPFALSVLDMLSSRTHKLLGESEIDNENSVGISSVPDREVVWLDISVDDSSRVDILDSLDHLIGDHQNSFYGKLLVTFLEKLL